MSTYQQIRNLVAPAKPTGKSFAELVKLVKDHHHPPPSAIFQRFLFSSRSQKEGETVAEFVAELRKLSEHCKFEATLDDMLRDRLVCGLRDSRLQIRLLAESELTFKKAFEMTQASEVAERNTKELQAGKKAAPVLTLRKSESLGQRQSTPLPMCYRCGGKHRSAECRFKDADCNHCGKKGHIARVCRSKAASTQKTYRPTKKTHQLTDVEPSALPEDATYTPAVIIAVGHRSITGQ